MNKTAQLFGNMPENNNQSNHFEEIRNWFTYEEEQKDDLCCCVCLEYPYPATSGVVHDIDACERFICQTCLTTDTCPFCSQFLSDDVAKVPRYVKNLYTSVKVKCNECDEVMEREFYEYHYYNSCMIKCETCHDAFNRVDLSIHLCPDDISVSDGCGLSFKREDLEPLLDEHMFFKMERLNNDGKFKFLVTIIEQLNQRVIETEQRNARLIDAIELLNQRTAEEQISNLEEQVIKICRNCGETFSDEDGSVCRYHPYLVLFPIDRLYTQYS
eukprot:TRINITY_DN436_c0_g1_i21.p1 TRINITY_DN436_c0_g1~~TRINITY_DN436_c0_g1_i21.p1  ORF type:complete len:271 (+),score=46.19 TRINITY_DN436_c0_g1_i21:67-879(+)